MTPDRRGLATSWRVTGLPDAKNVTVLCDGQPFRRYEAVGRDAIRVDTTVDTHRFRVVTGYRGSEDPVDSRRRTAMEMSGCIALPIVRCFLSYGAEEKSPAGEGPGRGHWV